MHVCRVYVYLCYCVGMCVLQICVHCTHMNLHTVMHVWGLVCVGVVCGG